MSVDAKIIARLKEAMGPKGFTEEPAEIAPHLEEWRGRYHGQSQLLLKPANASDVGRALAICNETKTPVVPQGGNTGLVGGQIPFHGEVLLSLERMNKVRGVDAQGLHMIAEAGVILANAHAAADEAGCLFPLSLASEGSCTIGGNLSTNAGGVDVLRYGNMRELTLGIEVVLADGTLLDMLRTLRKDNTGYDLKQLFIGAEGTLGIVTAAALKLFPKPAAYVTAMVALPSPAAAIALLTDLQHATGGLLSAFEIIPRIGMELVTAHIPGSSDPFAAPSPWYALVEASVPEGLDLRASIERQLGKSIEAGRATDAVIAASEAQRKSLWRLRENMSEAQKLEGASIKHDVSVPVARIPDFLQAASSGVQQIVPGARVVAFGHAGDGNIHFNISVPKGGDGKAFLAKWEAVSRGVHDIVNDMGGSISAEHGLGAMKHNEIARYKSKDELAAMRTIKRALDPNNILNPGKVLPD
ncbi:MAG TPA: FAD-binding oxidoreductase [Rhizomicrobium sp.]|jgi:D-lactate dehydrogenase (cytochrome)|nr:FAD-binding oxidoreductase [Rhizomicrobium sp.]